MLTIHNLLLAAETKENRTLHHPDGQQFVWLEKAVSIDWLSDSAGITKLTGARESVYMWHDCFNLFLRKASVVCLNLLLLPSNKRIEIESQF